MEKKHLMNTGIPYPRLPFSRNADSFVRGVHNVLPANTPLLMKRLMKPLAIPLGRQKNCGQAAGYGHLSKLANYAN